MVIDQNEYLELKALLADEESEVCLSRPHFRSHPRRHALSGTITDALPLARSLTLSLTESAPSCLTLPFVS